MKRFWKEAEIVPSGEGWGIALDGRPVKTPGRADLAVTSEVLARAIAAEWNEVDEKIDPSAMPMTGLANAAIDRVGPAKADFAAGLARYGETEMCCYRAIEPDELVARQVESWDPLLDWARDRYGIDFVTTGGVMHVEQPVETLVALSKALAIEDAFHLAGLSPLITAGGSLLAALAVRHGHLAPELAWTLTQIDEDWQAEQWGADAEATAAAENRRRDFLNGARFLSLL